MAEEARQLEPVRMFDDLGDANGVMKDWAPRLTKIDGIKPDEENALDVKQPNAAGYDPEHGVWINPPVEATKDLDALVHPFDGGVDPAEPQLPIGEQPEAPELPKATGIPAPN